MSPISSNRYAEAIFAIGFIKKVTGEKRQGGGIHDNASVEGDKHDQMNGKNCEHCVDFNDLAEFCNKNKNSATWCSILRSAEK